MWVGSLGWEDPLEEGMATHSNNLAWRIPWTEDPGGSKRVRQDRKDLACMCGGTPEVLFSFSSFFNTVLPIGLSIQQTS